MCKIKSRGNTINDVPRLSLWLDATRNDVFLNIPVSTVRKLQIHNLTCNRLPGTRALQIEHMVAEVVKFCLHELGGQVHIARIPEVRPRCAETRDMRICFDRFEHHVLQRRIAFQELVPDFMDSQEVAPDMLVVLVNLAEEVRDVVRLDDATAAPYGDDGAEIEVPLLLLVDVLEQIETLDERNQEGGISGFTEVFDECLLVGYFDSADSDMALEAFVDMNSLSCIGR